MMLYHVCPIVKILPTLVRPYTRGQPILLDSFDKNPKTVLDLLLSEACRYTGTLEYPSIPPWITIFHLGKILEKPQKIKLYLFPQVSASCTQ